METREMSNYKDTRSSSLQMHSCTQYKHTECNIMQLKKRTFRLVYEVSWQPMNVTMYPYKFSCMDLLQCLFVWLNKKCHCQLGYVSSKVIRGFKIFFSEILHKNNSLKQQTIHTIFQFVKCYHFLWSDSILYMLER